MARTPCPTRKELSQFSAGMLALAHLESIANHLGECPRCEQELEAIDCVDIVAAALRQPCLRFALTEQERGRAVAVVELAEIRRPIFVPSTNPEWSRFITTHAAPESGWRSVIGPYELLEKISRGGMGTVYKARHVELGTIVALKRIAAERVRTADHVARFHRATQAVQILDHPNIVRVTDAGECGGTYYVVMELLDGLDLSQVSERIGAMSAPDACEIVRQAALGIEYLHKHGLVHCDLRLSRLMLVRPSQSAPLLVKILQLGLAYLSDDRVEQQDREGASEPDDLESPASTCPVGVGSGSESDIRAAIYGLGCTLYELLSGETPPSALFRAVASRGAGRPDILGPVWELILRMTASDRSDRFSRAAEVSRALELFVEDCDLARLFVAEGSGVFFGQ
jgi:serine/threonine protein kinase